MKKACPICKRISITKTGRCSACGHQLATPHQARNIVKVWEFASSSSSKKYQTLLYSDASTSCDCPGWTRRAPTDANGAIVRTCRHTRAVDLGTADDEATMFHDYRQNGAFQPPPPSVPQLVTGHSPPLVTSTYAQRKLAL
jgi:RNA polymerase subunit RPABC4/transcription elongation factor Spt4